MTPCPANPSSAACVPLHMREASTGVKPWPISRRKAPSIVIRLPQSVPSSRKQASSVTVTGRPPRDTLLPTGRPAPALPSVMAIVRSTRLARIAAVATAGCTW